MRRTPSFGRVCFLFAAIAPACTVDATVADDVGETSVPTSTAADSTSMTGPQASSSSTDAGSETTTGGPAETTGADTADDAVDDGPNLDVAADTEAVTSACEDEDAPHLIYVMLATTPHEIWSYDPVANDFEWFATLTCAEIAGEVTGFSLDRDGDILVLSREPEDPEVLPNAAMQLTRVGPDGNGCSTEYYGGIEYGVMGSGPFTVDCADIAFVSATGEPDDERLFTHACTGGGFTVASEIGPLHRVDLDDDPIAFELLDVDDYTSVALAGTGDGHLYGVGGDQKIPGVGRILEYDQENGAILSTTLVPELDIGEFGYYIALAFYGGDLYTFGTAYDEDTEALALIMRRYDLDDDDGDGDHQVTVIEPSEVLPAGIFAAASPTCIPLSPEG